MQKSLDDFIYKVEHKLLPSLDMKSPHPYDPIQVISVAKGWKCLGVGNYAAVFMNNQYPDWVVKVYAREEEAAELEADVYKQIGPHPAYSELIYQSKHYLILKRLRGITLYDALHRAVRIPKQVIEDVEEALQYARKKGLTPCDVHGKNVMMENGRGYVVDVSDFYLEKEDRKWRDLSKAYYKLYVPTLLKLPIPIPHFVLNLSRYGYRIYRKWKK
ncbi:serine/threonine protein kinase [Priestia koreensis]|uniref:Serine/threonine protein kinase n=1 Tax=Priestia koreensis TaxID=284581 RepID=A0A0M0LID1_9BACI|nr:serine/threonine protein kinase [Priestia koreensis]KOO50667.1 serine/threonine protein kinase [Priestia koreensis]